MAIDFVHLRTVTGGDHFISNGVPGVDLGASVKHQSRHYVFFGDVALLRHSDWGEPWRLESPGIVTPGAVAAVSRNDAVIDVFWIRPDGRVGTSTWFGSWARPADFAPAGSAGPGAVLTFAI